MQNVPVKIATYLIVIVSALAWVILALAGGLELSDLKAFFSLIPKVVTVDLVVIALFAKWAWKWKIFKGWLVPFPNLNGTWSGHIYSEWQDPKTGKKPAPIPTMLTIKQSLSEVSCVMHTGEMVSNSYTEAMLIDPARQIKQLAYSYVSTPRAAVSERSQTHDGSIKLRIIESPERKLSGQYWTDRLTKGEIILHFHSKELLEEIPADLGVHPVTEQENSR